MKPDGALKPSCRGLTPEQLTKQPEAGKWSVAECMLHLNTAAPVMQKLMEQAMEEEKQDKKVGTGPFRIGPKGRLLVPDCRAAAQIQDSCAEERSSSCAD